MCAREYTSWTSRSVAGSRDGSRFTSHVHGLDEQCWSANELERLIPGGRAWGLDFDQQLWLFPQRPPGPASRPRKSVHQVRIIASDTGSYALNRIAKAHILCIVAELTAKCP